MPSDQAPGLADLGLPEGDGVVPDRHLRRLIDSGVLGADEPIPLQNVQPASLDLRLGPVAYPLRCSFLPDKYPVDVRLHVARLRDERIELSAGAVLRSGTPYLIPLKERLALPRGIRAKANPKSSTGRADVFCRVITDYSYRFDEISDGYCGPLFLEVVPLSFSVRVREDLTLSQLRLSVGRAPLTDDDLAQRHDESPLLYADGQPVRADKLARDDGLFLGLNLRGDRYRRVGYRAKTNVEVLDMTKVGSIDPARFWDHALREKNEHRIVLDAQRFYLLMSNEAVSIPPTLAAEMTAYDPTSGELRTHYAGFFDPGFGYDPEHRTHGSTAALEVRAHDVAFMIEHRQRVCKLTFEEMLEPPETLYGQEIGSNYQGQTVTLGKHFARPKHVAPRPAAAPADEGQLEFLD